MIPLVWIKSTERESFKRKLSKSPENENRENSLLINLMKMEES